MVEPLELGRFISTCRKEKNLTQKQLGEELGVTDRAVSKWENGVSQTKRYEETAHVYLLANKRILLLD